MLSPEDIAENIQISNLEEAVIMGAMVTYTHTAPNQRLDDANTW